MTIYPTGSTGVLRKLGRVVSRSSSLKLKTKEARDTEKVLHVTLSRYLNGKQETSCKLSYTRQELLEHISKKLQKHGYACRGCGCDITKDYDIEHKVPLKLAITADDVILLFSLDNLDVLCHSCNRHFKRDKLIAYQTLACRTDNKLVFHGVRCTRCGHIWLPRVSHPKKCPSCLSSYWNKLRKRDRKRQSLGE